MSVNGPDVREVPLQPARARWISSAGNAAEGLLFSLARHWLAAVNLIAAIFAGLPLLAPYLAATGHDGWSKFIFRLYSAVCHQLPSRSFFTWGHQMAYCQRNTAIYTSILVGGIAFMLVRSRLRHLGLRSYLLLIAPMALDGFTQLFGLRESTWQLRVITGSLFGLATVWLVYPVLEQGFTAIRAGLEEASGAHRVPVK